MKKKEKNTPITNEARNGENKALISLKNITKNFGKGETETHVLKGIDLDIQEGEFLVILGESGGGKSTLLNIIGGMDQPTSGSIVFDGVEYAGSKESELTAYRRNWIGFIFQAYNLMPTLTAEENLNFIAELNHSSMTAKEALESVGLWEKRKNYPAQLSGGQQQRVSIARALIKQPRVILADEPTAALDYETSIEVLKVLEDIIKSGRTLVMVTHNQEIAKMANRVVHLQGGLVSEIICNEHPASAKELVW